jgi:wyosine [tRNA(Phe)-imidazoG37] synthetase (radical SAM superfamily)
MHKDCSDNCIYCDYEHFNIGDYKIDLLEIDCQPERMVIAEINNHKHYLGDVNVDIHSAIFAWEKEYKTKLSDSQIQTILNNGGYNGK